MNNMSSSCRRCGGVSPRRYLQNGGCQNQSRYGGCQSTGDACTGCEGGVAYLDNHEGCQSGEFDYALAMVYSRVQEFRYLYECEAALGRGTIFAELDKPFEGNTVMGCRR